MQCIFFFFLLCEDNWNKYLPHMSENLGYSQSYIIQVYTLCSMHNDIQTAYYMRWPVKNKEWEIWHRPELTQRTRTVTGCILLRLRQCCQGQLRKTCSVHLLEPTCKRHHRPYQHQDICVLYFVASLWYYINSAVLKSRNIRIQFNVLFNRSMLPKFPNTLCIHDLM